MRRSAFLLLLLAGTSLCRAGPPAANGPQQAAEVKAAVVFNILQFVQWPPSPSPGQPLVFCLQEGAGLADALGVYEGSRIHNTTLTFQHLNRRMDHLAECQVAFVEAGAPYTLLRIASGSRNLPLLVIAEGDNVLQQGAGIGLTLIGGHLGIEVNLGLLRASGLSVSSKLLRLAHTVIE